MKPTRRIIREFGIRSRKSLGQNFLIDENILQKIVELADVRPDDYVLEIGPGPGSLTKYLVQKAKKVIAIEIEPEFARVLKSQIPDNKLEVIVSDVLKFNFNKIKMLDNKYKVISNLPYNISSQVIFKLLESYGIFQELYLMLQKEVAGRVVAKPFSRDYGILSIIAQVHSEPEILLEVGPEAFSPKPKVDSALVRFQISDRGLQNLDYEFFKRVIKACFSHRRKTILNSLAGSSLRLKKEVLVKL
jgi:16S rRNA (adenine1518-N6/adenine1519-N6)-dimethyltransferase